MVDLQIIPYQMDSGYYTALHTYGGFKFHAGGEAYTAVVDVAGPFNSPGGHTITVFLRPNDWADGSGYLWGKASATIDIKAIIDYFRSRTGAATRSPLR
jgi:hypothetical protein